VSVLAFEADQAAVLAGYAAAAVSRDHAVGIPE
jgi:basic membrane lipoprotein Med (substrate-binding protein (PBP1-ABC) superfamily)